MCRLKYIKYILKKPRILPRVLKGYYKSAILKKSLIRGIDIALTYDCPAKCKKCSAFFLKDGAREYIGRKELLNLRGALIDRDLVIINFTGGEPFLREDIVDLVKIFYSFPALISISTSSLIFDKEKIRYLFDVGVDIFQLSLNSSVPSVHDKIIGIPGAYDKVIEMAGFLRRIGIKVVFNTVATKELLRNDKDISGLFSVAEEFDGLISFILPARVGGWLNDDVVLTDSDRKKLNIFLKNKYATIDLNSSYRRGHCPAGTEKLYVSAYGDIFPCPFIHKKIGSIDNILDAVGKFSLDYCIN